MRITAADLKGMDVDALMAAWAAHVAKSAHRPVTLATVSALVLPLVAAIRHLQVAHAAALHEIATLKARPALEYRGVWRDGTVYSKNALVTCAGSMWLACAPTSARPGAGKTEWLLVAKGPFPER